MRVLALALTFVLSWHAAARPAGAAAPQVPAEGSILVVPFENERREGRLYWLTEASAVLVTRHLRARGQDAISRDDRLAAFDRLQLTPSASLSQATVIRVGQLVGATRVVLGSFAVEGADLVVRARTIRLDTGRVAAEAEQRGRLDTLFEIYAALSSRLAGAAGAAPNPAAVGAQEPLAAFESYIKGLLAETPAGQVRYLEAALRLAPGYDHARIDLWRVHTEQGEHARALAVAAAVPASSPLSRRARFLAAVSRVNLAQYDEAFQAFTALGGEAAAEISNNLGVVQLRRGGTPTAAPASGLPTYYFNKAVEAARDDPDYAFNLGYAYWFERDPRAGAYWLREAVRRNPADGDAHYVLGVALQAIDAHVEAEREKELARQLSSKYREWERRLVPGGEPVPKGLERLRTELDRPRLSLVETTAAPGERRDQQELAAFHLGHARRLFEQRRDGEAIDALKRSIYIAPYQAEAHLLLGRIHLRNGRLREATEALKISIWSQESVAARVALAETYLQAKDMLQARTQADLALTLDPDSSEARAIRARIR